MQAPAITLTGTARIDDAPLFGPLELRIQAGEWTCLLGPSGVGKTTVLRLIAGVDQVTQFSGEITASDECALPGRVALMAQSDLLLPWLSVLDNLMIGARLRGQPADKTRAAEVIRAVGLAGHESKRPGALSGGQRQRVALARTLMEDRPVVLLDEPFSALDAKTRSQMQDLTARLLDGRTVLMVTHDPAEAARMGHRIEVMGPGGLQRFPPPPGPAPRPVDDPETLAAQGRLLARLREAG